MDNREYAQLIQFCGEDAIISVGQRIQIEQQIKGLEKQSKDLELELKNSFAVSLSVTDILVASIAGIVCGAMNGLFKTVIPKHGKLKHKHSTTRTAVDYKVPKPDGMKGSVQGLHRQIGPGHDLGRFKEALDLMSGKTDDFRLWGKSFKEGMGGSMHPGNMKVVDFINAGGFKIPDDPKSELMNHLLIDFFTKTSLPLPFSSYLADYSPALAKIMLGMYDNGMNLKNLVGNVSSIAMLQLITHSYAYLFKSAKDIDLYNRLGNLSSAQELGEIFNDLNVKNKKYLKSKEFDVIQAIAHGASFLVDTMITTASKNYAGLFCLDYGTLICFSADVIKYLNKGTSDYRKTFKKLSALNNEILELDVAWYDNFRKDMLRIAENEHFYETFNPELIIANHNNVIKQLDDGQTVRTEMISELKEWKV